MVELVVVLFVTLVVLLAIYGVLAITGKSNLVRAKLVAEINLLKAKERSVTLDVETHIKYEAERVKAAALRIESRAKAVIDSVIQKSGAEAKAVEAEVKKVL